MSRFLIASYILSDPSIGFRFFRLPWKKASTREALARRRSESDMGHYMGFCSEWLTDVFGPVAGGVQFAKVLAQADSLNAQEMALVYLSVTAGFLITFGAWRLDSSQTIMRRKRLTKTFIAGILSFAGIVLFTLGSLALWLRCQ